MSDVAEQIAAIEREIEAHRDEVRDDDLIAGWLDKYRAIAKQAVVEIECLRGALPDRGDDR